MSLPIWRPICGNRRGPNTTSANTIRMSESAIPRLAYSIVGGAPMKANDNWPRMLLTNRALSGWRRTGYTGPFDKIGVGGRGPGEGEFLNLLDGDRIHCLKGCNNPVGGGMPSRPGTHTGLLGSQRIHCSQCCFQHPRPRFGLKAEEK